MASFAYTTPCQVADRVGKNIPCTEVRATALRTAVRVTPLSCPAHRTSSNLTAPFLADEPSSRSVAVVFWEVSWTLQLFGRDRGRDWKAQMKKLVQVRGVASSFWWRVRLHVGYPAGV